MAVGSLGQLTVDLVANTAGFERGMNQAERAVASTAKAMARQEAAADKLVGAIDPVAGALQRVTKQQIELEKHFQAGIIPKGEFERLNTILNTQANAVANTNKQFEKGAISAKQYQAALRNVPAQFTDIAVSLQAGQAPLTVLLQQGGQLKDMFGGVGGAAKALGGYVLGLVNPFTVAAAAAAVLTLAYKQGSDEQTAFQNALILTGNAAGTSSQALAQQAQDISKTVGTVGAAAAVLTQLASSGKIPASQFDMIAVAALKLQEATGIAAEETVKNFEKLAKDPVKYSKELNDSLNYLTAAQYAQIDVLQRQGDAAGAANLAEETYAQAITERANKVNENLGYVETAWRSVRNAAKEAWDAFLDIGRESTLDQKLATLEDGLNNIRQSSQTPIIGQDNPDLGNFGAGEKAKQEEIRQTLQAYQDETEAALRASQAAADNQKGINAVEALNKSLDDTASKQDKLAKRYAEIDKQVAAASKQGVAYSQAQIQQLRDAAAEQFKPDKVKQPKAYQEDAGQKLLDNLRQQNAALQLQSDTNDKLGTQAQALAKFNQQIADIKTKDILTADQKSLLASEDLIRAQLKRNVALESEISARKQATEEAQKLAAFTENQDSKLSNAQDGLNSQLAGLGMGEKARERLKEDLAIRQDYASQVDKLNKQFNTGAISEDLYDEETQILGEALAERLVMQQDYYNQVDEASKNLFIGLGESWNDYLTQSTDVAAQTKTLFDGAFGNLTDALYGFVTTGKLSFQDLAASFAQTALKMLIQYAAAQAIAAGLNAFTSTAAIPVVGPLAAPAAAASALAYAGGLSASIAGIAGMAHDGIDSVPQDGTWLLQKGERVTTAQTSAKLDKTLNDIKSPSNMGNTTVNLIEDPNRAGRVEQRQGDDGERFLDLFVADLMGDGRTKDAFTQKFNVQSVGR